MIMHSATAILAQSTINKEINSQDRKIIHSYWRHNKHHIGNNVSFAQYLLQKLSSGNYSQQKIIEYETKNSCTYNQLGHYIRCAAKLLQKFIIPQNEFVIFLGRNSFEYLALYFGIICIGAIPMNLPNTNNSLHDIRTFIIQHDIKYLIFDDYFDLNFIQKLLNSIAQIKKIIIYAKNNNNKKIENEKIIYLNDDWLNNIDLDDDKIDDELFTKNVRNNNVACLALNSNGTHYWPPRIFLHNNYSIITTCETIADGRVFEFRSIDRLLSYGSFEHLENFLMFISAIVNGCSIVLLSDYNYFDIIDAIIKYDIYLAMLPSNFLIKLLKDSGGSDGKQQIMFNKLIKIIAFGGKISSTLCRQFFNRFQNVRSIRHCYMMAETPLPITMLIRNSMDYDSAGYPLPNTQIKIYNSNNQNINNDDDDDEMLDANYCGLIAIGREKQMFAIGYLSNQSTRLMRLNFQKQQQNNNDNRFRWYITQDMGFYDDNGLIYLHGQYRLNSLSFELNSIIQQSRIETYLLNYPLTSEVYVVEIDDSTCSRRKYAALIALKFENTNYLTEKLSQKIISHIKDNINDIDEFHLFIEYNIPKTSCGRYNDCLIRKEILNRINMEQKY